MLNLLNKTSGRALKLAPVTLALACVNLEARAQTYQPLDAIVITPSRTVESADRVGSAVTVISRDEIAAARAENVLDLLETVPGVAVNQSGGLGGNASVFIRGAKPEHTLVLLDGVRIGDPSGISGEFDFSLFTLANVERIEVLRGPQSGLYGSDAIGGVINIITRKGDGPPQATAEIEGGSYTTHAERAFVSGAQDGVAVSAGVSNFRTAGFSAFSGGDEDDAVAKQSANIRLDADVAPHAGFTFTAGRYHIDAEFDGFLADTNDTTQKTLSTGALTGRLDFLNGGWRNKVTLFANETDRRFEYDFGTNFDYLGQRYGVEAQSDFDVRQVDRLTIGGKIEHETAESFDETGGVSTLDFEGEERTQSAFAIYSFNPGSALNITAAGRIDDFGSAGIENTYRFTAAYLIAETGTKLRGSYGTGAKAPSLYQLADSPFVIGNPELEIETSKGFDIGLDQELLDGRITLSATYFDNDIENLIVFETVSFDPFKGTYRNIDAARTEGVEFAASLIATPWLTLSGAYTYLDAIDAETGFQLARRPQHAGNLKAAITPTDRFTLTASAFYVGERFDRERETGFLDDHFRVNIYGNYDLHKDAEIFFRVENLFDEQYEEILNFGTADRSAYAGIRAKF